VRIAHIVNVVDGVGSYGGPLRVAMNQVEALGRLGHDAVLVAGAAGGTASASAATGSLPVRLRRSWNVGRTSGFATRWAPGVHWWLLRHARSLDVVQVHLGRDLTTAPAAALLRLLRVPYVVQTHGMIDPSQRRLAAVLDAVLVRPALRGASRVLVLTPKEQDDVTAVMGGAPLPLETVPNGVAMRPEREAGTRPGELPEVLFLSRRHERKRPVNFVRAAQRLRAAGVRARFTVVGPDEGELGAVRAAIEQAGDPEGLIRYEGVAPMSGSVDRIAAADVFVLPSVAEPFPMAVVEAMSAGLAVVCSESCGLAPLVRDAGAVVADDDVDGIAAAARRFVEEPELAAEAGRNARKVVAETLSIDAVARQLVTIYGGNGPR
jgi:glycosyltransferase involved in cell wall biosynthesis